MEAEDMQVKMIAVIILILAIAVSIVYFLFMIDRTPPDAPVLSSPLNGLIVQVTTGLNGPAFDWYQPEQGLTYELQIARNAQFTNIVLSKTRVPPASYAVKPNEALADGTHYWQVRAIDKAGNVGPWSEIGVFEVKVVSS
jgi:predicted phage tail protein